MLWLSLCPRFVHIPVFVALQPIVAHRYIEEHYNMEKRFTQTDPL